MCILFVRTLLKAVSHYDLSVLSMSVSWVSKKNIDRGWVGDCYPVFFGIFEKIEH